MLLENQKNKIEKVNFDDSTYIWKSKLNFAYEKDLILKEALNFVEKSSNSKKQIDAYPYILIDNLNFNGNFSVKTKLDSICLCGIELCMYLYKEEFSLDFNKISTDSWVNIVRSKNPVQSLFVDGKIKNHNRYHSHSELNEKNNLFIPTYTYIYYIQMPDIMDGEDGVLYFKGKNEKEYWIRPKEDELIIMPASMPHAPNNAPKSTIDRIVMAGNVGFEFVKKQKSLL